MSKKLAIIATHGSLDAAYPPLILATAAVAMDMEAAIFFTFYGLEIIKKGNAEHLKVAPIANPAMPMPIPSMVGVLPGMTAMATGMMHKWMQEAKVLSIGELLETAKDLGVRLIGCQMTMDVLHIRAEDLIDGIEIGGAATFLDFASEDAIALSF
ncbi:MAG: DsrE/DsrF/DrsH-like family protein [Anaerolineales bacterium]|jgi:peroxiredoxin family protein